MYTFVKAVEPLLMPVPLIGLALVAAALASFRRGVPKGLRWWWLASATAFCLVAGSPAATLIAGTLERPFRGASILPNPPPAGAIVILAGGADVPRASGRPSELSGASWRRLWQGVQVYTASGGALPVIYVGKPVLGFAGAATEGSLARQAATRWGIPDDRFWLEEEARDTYESALGVRRMLEQRGLPMKVILVTSAWHLRRAGASFTKQGIAVVPEPSDFRGGDRFSLSGWLPTYEALAVSSMCMREWIALAS